MRIVQITDPHLTIAAGSADPAAALTAVLARVAALDPPPDRVIFTGDLTEHGAPEEYALFCAIVADCRLPMAAVPGNHDRREAFAAGLAGSGVVTGALPFLNLAIETGPVRLLCLDTLDEGAPGGLLCDARLGWVADRLAADDDRPVLVFMHHPPFRIGQHFADASNCRGGERLAALLAGHPRLLAVAAGHTHMATTRAWAGTVGSTCPAVGWEAPLDGPPGQPFALVPQKPAFQVHAWSESLGLVTHTRYLHDATPASGPAWGKSPTTEAPAAR